MICRRGVFFLSLTFAAHNGRLFARLLPVPRKRNYGAKGRNPMRRSNLHAAKQSSKETFEIFTKDGTLQRKRIMRSPLFVFLSRQFERPPSRYEERFSFRSDCRAVESKPCHLLNGAASEMQGNRRERKGEK